MKTGGELALLFVGALALLLTHAGYALRECGSVRMESRVPAMLNILALFAVSGIAYAALGYYVGYGFNVRAPVLVPAAAGRHNVIDFLLMLALVTAVPAIVSGAVAERARLWPQLIAAVAVAGLVYPFLERLVWARQLYAQHLLVSSFGASFHDFSGTVLVHVMAGWLALVAAMFVGPRAGRFGLHGEPQTLPPSSVPWLSLGTWVLMIAWLAVLILSAGRWQAPAAVVAVNGLTALLGGVLGVLITGRHDTRLAHGGALAGLIAVSVAADLVHTGAALFIGAVAGALLVLGTRICESYWRVDDVVGAWPLHGIAGAWGGIASGVFAQPALGGAGGISFMAQLMGTLGGIGLAVVSGFVIYGSLNRLHWLRAPDSSAITSETGTSVEASEGER